MKCYVYSERNYGELTADIGAATDILVFGSADHAARHLAKKVEDGKSNGFIPEPDAIMLEGDEVDIGAVKYSLKKFGEAGVTMYFQHRDNWRCYYDCIIEKREVIRQI